MLEEFLLKPVLEVARLQLLAVLDEERVVVTLGRLRAQKQGGKDLFDWSDKKKETAKKIGYGCR